jgi:hypothetical protein
MEIKRRFIDVKCNGKVKNYDLLFFRYGVDSYELIQK